MSNLQFRKLPAENELSQCHKLSWFVIISTCSPKYFAFVIYPLGYQNSVGLKITFRTCKINGIDEKYFCKVNKNPPKPINPTVHPWSIFLAWTPKSEVQIILYIFTALSVRSEGTTYFLRMTNAIPCETEIPLSFCSVRESLSRRVQGPIALFCTCVENWVLDGQSNFQCWLRWGKAFSVDLVGTVKVIATVLKKLLVISGWFLQLFCIFVGRPLRNLMFSREVITKRLVSYKRSKAKHYWIATRENYKINPPGWRVHSTREVSRTISIILDVSNLAVGIVVLIKTGSYICRCSSAALSFHRPFI